MDPDIPDIAPVPPAEFFPLVLERLQSEAMRAIDAGGPIAVLLVAMSVAALSLVILKIWQFARLRLGRRRFVGQAVKLYIGGDDEAALSLLTKTPHPIARAMETAVLGLRRTDVDVGIVREDVIRVAEERLRELRAYIRPLEVIAALSPLLGLLGTVMGMIAVFGDIAGADSRVSPALLSGGIWEALLTTAIGMAAAIPTIVAVNWIEGKVEGVSADMESAVTRLFTADLNRFDNPKDGSVAKFAQAAE